MAFAKGVVVEVPLKQHQGTLRYATSWESDGASTVWMDFILMGLAANAIDGKVVVRNSLGAIMGEHIAGLPPNEFGNIPLHIVVPAGISGYGEWTADITIRENNSTTTPFGWEYDGRYLFNVTKVAAPPIPPPPPPGPDPCAFCATGTHCEGGLCVPDPPPPPPPGWLEKLKALFPVQLQQYAVPIAMGVGILAYQGFKRKR